MSNREAMAPHSSTLAWKNPMDGGAWWAAVRGVAKSQTWLRWLSSRVSKCCQFCRPTILLCAYTELIPRFWWDFDLRHLRKPFSHTHRWTNINAIALSVVFVPCLSLNNGILPRSRQPILMTWVLSQFHVSTLFSHYHLHPRSSFSFPLHCWVALVAQWSRIHLQYRRGRRYGFDPWVGSGNPLQYSCLENPMDREPGGLHSIELQRVRYDGSNLAPTYPGC